MKPVAFVLGLLAGAATPGACSFFGQSFREEPTTCPTCDELFPLVETTPSGERVGVVHYQQRGEPKSGTGVVFDWATKAISQACSYLNDHFGEGSCHTRYFWPSPLTGDAGNRTLIFEPRFGRENARCPCDNVDRVQVVLFNTGKHLLPVDDQCAWSRASDVSASKLCASLEGHDVTGYEDLVRCMQDAACPIKDERLQLVIMRDPRAMAVSAYHYNMVYGRPEFKKRRLEEYVVQVLPVISQWVAIRHFLFEYFMADKATVLYYDEILGDPTEFYRRFLGSIGLRFPSDAVEDMALAVNRPRFPIGVGRRESFRAVEESSASPSFKDELSSEVLEQMDEIVRVWLPPELLVRFGITASAME